MDKKALSLSAVVALVVASGFALLVGPSKTTVKEVVKEVVERVGAIPGNEIPTAEFIVNGRRKFYYSSSCNDASTTIVSVQNPFGTATATVDYFSIRGTNGTTSIAILVATSTGSGAPTIDLPGSLVSSSSLAVSRNFYLVPRNPGADRIEEVATYSTVTSTPMVIGGNQYLVAQATGTANGSSAANVLGVTNAVNTFSCTYELEISR